MNDIVSLIENSAKAKNEMAAATVRMPKELYAFIEGLADHIEISRQEVMLKLLEKGAEIAMQTLKLDDVKEGEAEVQAPLSGNFHILNTNKRHSIEDHEMMLTDKVAAAFYDPWKRNINRIKAGDVVFLYENGKGIVAFGTGTGETLKATHHGRLEECYYQELQDFRLLDKPISAAEIKKHLDKNIVLLRTMSPMPDGQKVLDLIEKNS
jgi:predicted transcriptional regulator